jgi:hypothetical protein
MYARVLSILLFSIIVGQIQAQRYSVIEMKVDASYFYESYPDMVLLDFLIYSESESKGSIPIENIESLVILEMQKHGIPAYQLVPSTDMYSINPKYKKYRLTLNSKEEYDLIFPYLSSNPFVQSLKIAKKVYLKETKKTLNENLILGAWREMDIKSREMAAVQNKKISKVDEIDATQLFDLKLHEKENSQSFSLKKDRFESRITTRFQIHNDSSYYTRKPTYLIVLGEGADTFPSNSLSLKFDVFNNEIKKSEINLKQINQNVLNQLNRNGIVDFEQRQDEYEDVIRYEISHLTYSQYVSMIDFLAQNKNIINLEIKHNPWKDAAYDLTKTLWYKALNDAKQKANKVAKFLNMDIVGMKEVGNWNDQEMGIENKWIGRSEAYNVKEWKYLGEIQKKEVLRVVFEID